MALSIDIVMVIGIKMDLVLIFKPILHLRTEKMTFLSMREVHTLVRFQ